MIVPFKNFYKHQCRSSDTTGYDRIVSGRSADPADLPYVMEVVTMVVMAVMMMLDVMGLLCMMPMVDSGVMGLGKWG
jgi:hypothetical protein